MGRRIGIPDDADDWSSLLNRVDDLERFRANGFMFAEVVPTWTGSSTNPVINNGVLKCSYVQVGEIVHATWNVVAGTLTTFGSGGYGLSLPVAAAAGERWALAGDLLDVSAQHYEVMALIDGGSAFEEILAMSNSTGPTNWTSASPFAFGDTDRMTISGIYRADV